MAESETTGSSKNEVLDLGYFGDQRFVLEVDGGPGLLLTRADAVIPCVPNDRMRKELNRAVQEAAFRVAADRKAGGMLRLAQPGEFADDPAAVVASLARTVRWSPERQQAIAALISIWQTADFFEDRHRERRAS